MAKQFTLGKEERLKSRKTIERLFKEGKSFAVKPFRVYYEVDNSILSIPSVAKSLPKSGQQSTGRQKPATATFNVQFGAGVSSKQFRKAVDRNRIKRLMKEAWRLQKTILRDKLKEQKKKLHIFFIYTGKELPAYKEVYDMTGKIIEKVYEIINTVK